MANPKELLVNVVDPATGLGAKVIDPSVAPPATTSALVTYAMNPTATGQGSGFLIDETGTRRTIQRAFANATASGNTVVVAAQGAGVKIRVIAVFAISATALTLKFQSNTTDICSGKPVAATGGWVGTLDHGWFQTAANEALNINLSIAGTVGVDVDWIPVT